MGTPSETTTIDPGRSPLTPAGRAPVVALTILHHPDVSRVGQRALLSMLRAGRSARLSRLVPKFGPPQQDPSEPLNESFISRQPIFIEAAPDGVVLHADEERSRAVIDGVPVAGTHQVPAEVLDAGAVLELSDCVTLLLHRIPPPSEQNAAQLGLIGQAPSIHQLRTQIRRVAPRPAPVLILGESGVGKELAASAIHQLSPRADKPLVSVNMATLSTSMAASELFGHVRGAFTGAVSDKRGLFQRADGGTLFLDEVGDTPYNVQAQLLRAIETGVVQAVGAERPEQIDVRFIAATDVDLGEAVDKGSFRQALLHRLGGYVLEVPPLRARREDIGRLLLAFLREELTQLGRADRLDPPASGARPWLPSWLVAAAARHSWPGNVRELRNAVRQIAIDWADAPEIERDARVARRFPIEPPARRQPPRERRNLGDINYALIKETLQKHAWQPAPAASELGISRTSLYKLMRQSPDIRMAGDLERDEIAAALQACEGDVARAAMQLTVSEPGLRRRMHKLGI